MANLQIDSIAQYLDAPKTDWIVEQGERQLEYLHEAGSEVNKKAQLLLNVSIALATGLITFIVSHWDATKSVGCNFIATGALWVSTLFIIYAGFLFLRNARTENFTRLGSRPANMTHPEFVRSELNTMKQGYLFEIERRITLDEIRHGERCDRVNRAVTILSLTPVAAILIEAAKL